MTETDINKIIDLYLSGISTNKIAKQYNCNSGTIYYILQKHSIPIRKIKKFNGKTSDYIEQIKSMYLSGMSSTEISKQINLSQPTILRCINKLDITRHNPDISIHTDNILKLFKSNTSPLKIAKQYNCSYSTIANILKKNGQKLNPTQKYSLDETFFEKIDSEEKAYILGWFYSDGNVTKNGKCRIQIHHDDREILEKIRNCLKYTGGLIDIKPRNSSAAQVLLNIDRKKVAEDLQKLGVFINKSLILKFPTYEQVPKYLMRHFIRGVFDGDGSISFHNRGNGTISINCAITSTKDFCHSLTNFLSEFNITPTNFYQRRPNKPCGSLFFSKKSEISKFLDFIYRDANIYLTRKYNRYLLYQSKCINNRDSIYGDNLWQQ